MKILLCGKGYPYEQAQTVIKAELNGIKKLTLQAVKNKLVILMGYPYTITEELIIKSYLIINVHTSLLPKYRGRHPIVWALINGEKEIGVTIHMVYLDIDTGAILLQDSIPVELEDDYQSVLEKLTKLSLGMLPIVIKQIEKNCYYRRRQIERFATYTPRRKKEDSELPYKLTTEQMVNFIRALHDPMPNAFVKIGDKKVCLKISKII
jgi:methionyl-tRNA formyltransferase